MKICTIFCTIFFNVHFHYVCISSLFVVFILRSIGFPHNSIMFVIKYCISNRWYHKPPYGRGTRQAQQGHHHLVLRVVLAAGLIVLGEGTVMIQLVLVLVLQQRSLHHHHYYYLRNKTNFPASLTSATSRKNH